MLMPWRFRQPLAAVRSVVEGANTLYLCSPRGEQRHYEPLFRGALRMVLEEQQRQVDAGTQRRRVLLVLDEAATVASLDELDQTGRDREWPRRHPGHGGAGLRPS
jgi:hypothetical protein